MSRVTRLGEVSHVKKLFTLSSCFERKKTEAAQFFVPFFHSKNYVLILTKMGQFKYVGQQFWSIFGRFWSILVNFGRFWSILVDFDRFWSSHPVGCTGQISIRL
jgi:hypothetical protein